MIEINVNKLKKSFGFGELFNDINFEIKTGEKVSIVGINGSGKSTLLKLINKEILPASGTISIRNNAKIAYLGQNITLENDNILVKDILYRSVNDIIEIENKLREYESIMTNISNDKLNKALIKYSNLQEKFINIGGYEISEKIGRIITGFNIEHLIDKEFNKLSGGETRIVTLASIMINNPDILLLDEPTNHLDINTLEWFEEYLINSKCTIVIVSHDRYFLDKVTNKTILIENGKSITFHGNYSYFLKENELRLNKYLEDYKLQQKKINNMKKQVKQLKEWGKIGDNGIFFKRAHSIEKRIDKIDKLDKPIIKKDIPINFNINNRTGNEVLKLNNYSLSIGNKELINNSNLVINYKDRVCIIGKNGCGKTTLIKDIINRYNKEKDSSLVIGTKIKIGYIPQEIIYEDDDKTVYDIARNCFKGEESKLRSALHNFMFYNDSIFKRVKNLSGGEKLRLKLFELNYNNSNFIILDEPTNHIDIETKEVLEQAIIDFEGTLLFISHDRYFINNIANKIIYFDNNKLNLIEGNYDDYKEYLKLEK